MSDTRDPHRRGRVPFPGRRHTGLNGLNGTSAPAQPTQPPADEELVRQLSVVLGEISDPAEAGPTAGSAGQRGAMARARLEAAAAVPVANLARLKRSMQDSLSNAEPEPDETSTRRKKISRVAPLVALAALVSLGVAVIYVLNPAPETPPGAPMVTGRVAALAPAAQAVPAAMPATAAPARNESRPVRVETVRVTPRQAPVMAAVNPPARAVAKAPPRPVAAPRNLPAQSQAVAKSPVVTATVQPQRPVAPARRISAAVENAMLTRGREMMARVDVSGARLAYRFLAERGSAKGALALAESYDPALLSKLAVVGMTGDRAEAARLYRQAAALGSTVAAQRLAQGPAR